MTLEPELVPAVNCPRCGKPPALRISVFERQKKMNEADDAVVLSYKCRHCPEIYFITAKAYKGAA